MSAPLETWNDRIEKLAKEAMSRNGVATVLISGQQITGRVHAIDHLAVKLDKIWIPRAQIAGFEVGEP